MSATLASCGGATDRVDDSSDGGTAGNGAVSGSAGKGGTASRGGTGGAAHGGTGAGVGGTGAGVGGTGAGADGGVGGMLSLCSLPAETGPCEAAFERFFHNVETGSCEPFVYGGCEGNENNFETFEACEAACGSKVLDACEDNDDCVLHARSCCGACEPSQLSDFVALNAAFDESYAKTMNCQLVDCGPCPEPETSNRPYFVATCQANRCVAVDLRTTAVTECAKPSDCSLRFGSRCCEGCDGTELIAVSDEGKLAELVCPKEPPPCLACELGDPLGVAADCESGRCVVEPLVP